MGKTTTEEKVETTQKVDEGGTAQETDVGTTQKIDEGTTQLRPVTSSGDDGKSDDSADVKRLETLVIIFGQHNITMTQNFQWTFFIIENRNVS